MIVADSIGFAATHTICGILSELPGFDVSHGSQNFETKAPIGPDGQSPAAFTRSMAAAAAAGRHPVAVHTNFPPKAMQAACAGEGITYRLLVRDPQAQIESCYAWIAKKVLDGDAPGFLGALKVSLAPLQGAQIAASLPNVLYAFALQHVCGFNLMGLQTGAEVLRMEDLLSEEAAFRAAFEVPADCAIPHFEGEEKRLASHRSRSQLEALGAPERDVILDRLKASAGGISLPVSEMTKRLGYA
ncbi:hypothetical protein [Maritimibacter alkaliphilus]|uniref:hypothetical protein n=1 Tax=Maritimibacter alkaliphilus TaxID=404236 RepID=UPI001C938771|nr:hypothetical protein [Maritimibacter alkaliphilus]MBY6091151.1 hypothetical protein [Maritimibacter alkaliphilus]